MPFPSTPLTRASTVEPPSNEISNPQVPIIIIEVIDKPSPPLPTAPIEEQSNTDEGEMEGNSDGDDDDSDVFEDAPQTPSDIVDILGGEETRKHENEHLGAQCPSVTSIAV